VNTSSTAQDIAHVLFEALVGTALDQLRAASKNLMGQSDQDMDLQQRVEAALPPDALPPVRNFLLSLANEGQLDHIGEIMQAFESYSKRGVETQKAVVTSAINLQARQRERITKDLQERYGEALDIEYVVDESLLGGLVIRVGDQVLDNSLRSRLGAIRRNMLTI
jgi:F-type H+-transporting ATPase subunit delta